MEKDFQAALKGYGRSVTKSRQRLFDYFRKAGTVTVKQFLDENKAVADRASLYRTLLLFKNIGVVEERLVAGRRLVELSDSFDAHHHHLTCVRCGHATHIAMPEIEAALEAVCAQSGFTVERHIIEADGLCAACQTKALSRTTKYPIVPRNPQ